MKKNAIQDNELKNVAGGGGNDDNLASLRVSCGNCGEIFMRDNVEQKFYEDGCDEYQIYKCPKCGKWVDINGEIKD